MWWLSYSVEEETIIFNFHPKEIANALVAVKITMGDQEGKGNPIPDGNEDPLQILTRAHRNKEFAILSFKPMYHEFALGVIETIIWAQNNLGIDVSELQEELLRLRASIRIRTLH